jgi:hypothetical protein
MSCPLNRNRWAGSGYVKQTETAGSKEMDARVAAMMAERDAQDAKSFPGPMPPTRPAGGCSGGTCPPPKKTAGGNGGK